MVRTRQRHFQTGLGKRGFLVGSAALGLAAAAQAATDQITIARQVSIGHLPLMIMEAEQLVEKELSARGLTLSKVNYVALAGGSVMNDALLSGSIQFAAGGVPPLVLLWSKTHTTRSAVKGVAAMNSIPLLMNTTNPKIKSLHDFTDSDKIALPAVKVSVQAMFLQMAAEQQLGPDHRNDLDRLTVTLSHPDGMAAMFAGQVDTHFTAPPIQDFELRRPGVHTVLDTFRILGAPSTFNVIWASSAFIDRNPEIHAAFTAALEKAIAAINTDKKLAAAIYVRLSKDPSDGDVVADILADPRNNFTTTPQSIGKYVEFMSRTGVIRSAPGSWKDLFFDNVSQMPGD